MKDESVWVMLYHYFPGSMGAPLKQSRTCLYLFEVPVDAITAIHYAGKACLSGIRAYDPVS